MLTALWYSALREQPIRIVVVRDPSGRRRDEAFFCTDLCRDAAFVLETYAHCWTLEVTFHDSKQYLGFGQAQSQTPTAVQRTPLPPWTIGGGTSSAGLRSKKPTGFSEKPMYDTGMTGQSSGRTTWWEPNVYQTTTSVFSIGSSFFV